ncbi:Nuclear transport factor 2B [Coccomyxa viridis]|uniref:Nuclear transport factor 2B n=1 Tax=Coccomyxa viridis TaxID=1274662 RepID=A0AAV1ILI0_9CHLO|nr:Nuclear transport factor 2B [Coccomyxa viridis]
MGDPHAIAKAFQEHYYSTFDSNRQALSGLYKDDAYLTFEGQTQQGCQAIMQKLSSLPFQQVKHHIASTDAQPSASGGLNVFVTGQILTEGESNPLKFSQMFHLAAQGSSFVITNDIFRLNYG